MTISGGDGESRLRGSLSEHSQAKLRQREIVGAFDAFSFAKILHSEPDNEDAPPIAKDYGSRKFLFVADGMGGAGAHKLNVGGSIQTEAHVVAHRLSHEVDSKLIAEPNILHAIGAQAEAKIIEGRVLAPLLSRLDNEFSDQKSGLGGRTIKRFPTTMSTITINETADSIDLQCAWAGDSPIFIITPDAILTTHMQGDGDKPIENAIHTKSATLDYQDVHLRKGTPYIAICATDAILKLPGGEFQGAMRLISEALIGTPHSEAPNKMHDVYLRLREAGGEKDDATVSVHMSGHLRALPDLKAKHSIWSARK